MRSPAFGIFFAGVGAGAAIEYALEIVWPAPPVRHPVYDVASLLATVVLCILFARQWARK